MTESLILTGVSALAIILLVVLYRAEENRGRRLVFATVRGYADRGINWIEHSFDRLFRYINVHVIRVSFHYIVHSVLGVLIAFLHRMQAKLSHLQLRNRYLVKAVKGGKREASHLRELSHFKEENSLSEKKKQELKELK